MRRVLLAATLAALLVPVAPAAASTLTFENGTMTFTGAGAAANDVTIGGTQSGTQIEINDADTVTAGTTPAGCIPVTSGVSYVCGPTNVLVLNLGPGNDTVAVDNNGLATPTSMSGGDGAD